MGLFEDAVIYATEKHNGQTRKIRPIPSIMHSLEVAHIISTMTDELEIMAAGVLHDVVEDTDGTIEEIKTRFGDRVAYLVQAETENKYKGEDKLLTWKKRKEESLAELKVLDDRAVEILWLGDKLSNMRSFAEGYRRQGEALWEAFHQKDAKMHYWYYQSIADIMAVHLSKTDAYQEYVSHINYIWKGDVHDATGI